MPDVEMLAGDTIEIPFGDHFLLPAGCVELARELGITLFEATSSDPAVAVSIAADLTTLVVAATETADSARVTLYYIDFPHSDFHEFTVRVRAP